MLAADRILKLPDASVRDRKVEVELADDSRRRNRFFLPPIHQLSDTKRYQAENREITQQADDTNIAKAFREEFESLFRKYDRFKTSPIFLTRLANLSKACGEIEKALEFSRQAVEVSKQPIYSFKYAEAAFNAGQRDLSHKLLMQLDSQQYSDAYLRLAENFINVGKIDIAEHYIGKALNQNLDDWKARMVAGTLELVKGQHEQAVRHYRVALVGRPNSSLLYTNIAVAHYLLGNVKSAFRDLKRALGYNPTNKNAVSILADIGVITKYKLAEVPKYLQTFLYFHPDSKTVLERLTNTYFVLGDNSQAIRLLEHTRKSINYPGLLNNLGVAYANKKNIKQAAINFINAIELAGGIKKVYSDRGAELAAANSVSAFIELRHLDQAENLAKAYITNSPDDRYITDKALSKIAFGLVGALISQRKYRDALKLADQYLNNRKAHPWLKVALNLKLGTYFSLIEIDLDAAYQSAKMANDVIEQPENAKEFTDEEINMVVNNMAFVLIEANQLEKATDFVRRLRTDLPNWPEFALATKGLFAIRTGNIDKGAFLYERAISICSNADQKKLLRQKMLLELGRYWVASGDTKKATQLLTKGLKLKEVGYPIAIRSIYQSIASLLNEIKLKEIKKLK